MPSFSKSLPVLFLVGASALAGPIARDQSAAYIEHCIINGEDCSLYFKELDPKSTFCLQGLSLEETKVQLTKCHNYMGTLGLSSGAQSKSGVTVGGPKTSQPSLDGNVSGPSGQPRVTVGGSGVSSFDGDSSGHPGLSIGDANSGPNQQSPAECTNEICVSHSGFGSLTDLSSNPLNVDTATSLAGGSSHTISSDSLLSPSTLLNGVGLGSQSDSENGIDENVNESGSGSSFVPSLAFDSSLKPLLNIGLGQSGHVSNSDNVNVHNIDSAFHGSLPNVDSGSGPLDHLGPNYVSSDADVSIHSGDSNGTGAHVGNGQSIDPNAALGSNDGVTRVSLQTGSNNDPTSKIGSNGGLAPKIVSIDGTTPKINSNDGATPQTGDDDSDCGCKEVL